jgi:AcrR family transcriptional regulator
MAKREIEGLSREVVIATARRLLEHSGEEGLSFRGVARDLGVTAPALYAYVEDKQELLAALATEHFAKLAGRFEAVDASLDPIDRNPQLSRAYLDHRRRRRLPPGHPGLRRGRRRGR